MRRPTRRTGRWLVAGVVAVLVVGGGATAYAQSGTDPASGYRLATVSGGTVEETLTSAGTVDNKHRADVAFGTSGAVAAVKVSLGQKVRSGQVIATLETDDAQAAVDSADATLAKARAQLVTDEAAQSSAVSSSTSSASGSGFSGKPKTQTPKTQTPKTQTPKSSGTSGSGGTGSGSGTSTDTQAVTAALVQLSSQQQAVTSGQSAVTQALADAASALTAQQQACSTSNGSGSGSGNGTGSGTGSGTGTTGVSQACQDALTAVQTKQAAVKDAEQSLSEALTSLTTTLTNAVAALQKAATAATTTASPTASSATSRTTATASTVAYVTTSATADGGSQSVTAATLAKDQAAIDTARAGLIQAQRSLSATVVKTPMAGTIASLDLTKGDSVSSGDTAAVVTAGEALLIDTDVSESRIRDIMIGQKVVVSTPGSSTKSSGTVTAIGVTADSGSSSVVYPVTVQVDNPTSMLASGSSVVLSIVTSTASNVITVPSSAVTTSGTRSTVQVYKAGVVTSTPVTLGAVGTTRTQVKSGLKTGQRVVLADLSEKVTGAATTVTTRGGGLNGGGFGGPGGATGGGTGGVPGGGTGAAPGASG